jgi:hypothetical protein
VRHLPRTGNEKRTDRRGGTNHNANVAGGARGHAKLGVVVEGHVCITIWPDASGFFGRDRGRGEKGSRDRHAEHHTSPGAKGYYDYQWHWNGEGAGRDVPP